MQSSSQPALTDWAASYLADCEQKLAAGVTDPDRRFAIQLALRRLEGMASASPDEFLRATLAGHLMVLCHLAEQNSDAVETGLLKAALAVLDELLTADGMDADSAGTPAPPPKSGLRSFFGFA